MVYLNCISYLSSQFEIFIWNVGVLSFYNCIVGKKNSLLKIMVLGSKLSFYSDKYIDCGSTLSVLSLGIRILL